VLGRTIIANAFCNSVSVKVDNIDGLGIMRFCYMYWVFRPTFTARVVVCRSFDEDAGPSPRAAAAEPARPPTKLLRKKLPVALVAVAAVGLVLYLTGRALPGSSLNAKLVHLYAFFVQVST
jgi:hypothetical protein